MKAFGKVDILVNSAGKIKRAPTLTFPEDEWRDIVDTNLTGTLRACQIFGAHMLDRGYGRIINIASLNSYVALAEVAAYAASKAAVASLTRSLAVEWSKKGVLVNAIAPGVFRTALNSDLLDNTPRGKELLMRTPMGAFRKDGGAGWRGDVSGVGGSVVRYRPGAGGGWRIPGERRESVRARVSQ